MNSPCTRASHGEEPHEFPDGGPRSTAAANSLTADHAPSSSRAGHPQRRGSPLLPLLALALLASGATAASVRSFPTRRDLQPPAERNQPIGSVTLDEAVYEATDDAYANLRLFDDAGTETPFIVRPRRQEQSVPREYEVAFRQTDFHVLPDNQIQIRLEKDRSLDAPIAIAFDTPLDNFEKQVQVFASADGNQWESLAEAQPIFDYARFMSVRDTRVDLPASTHRFFRIELSNITESRQSPLTQMEWDRRGGAVVSEVERSSFQRLDFRIDRIRLIGQRIEVVRNEPLLQPYAVMDAAITNDANHHTSTITFRTARPPVLELEIVTDSANFRRTVDVEGANEAGHWAPLTSSGISRVRAGKYRQENVRVRLSQPARCRQFRVTVHNLDSPPLNLAGVRVRGTADEVVFFREAGDHHRLYYGVDGVPAPSYDVATVLSASDAADSAVYALGPSEANPDFDPGATPVAPDLRWWNSRGLLIAAVLAVVAVLGWVLARAVRQMPPSSTDDAA